MEYTSQSDLYADKEKRVEVVKRRYARDLFSLQENLKIDLERIYYWYDIEAEMLRSGDGKS